MLLRECSQVGHLHPDAAAQSEQAERLAQRRREVVKMFQHMAQGDVIVTVNSVSKPGKGPEMHGSSSLLRLRAGNGVDSRPSASKPISRAMIEKLTSAAANIEEPVLARARRRQMPDGVVGNNYLGPQHIVEKPAKRQCAGQTIAEPLVEVAVADSDLQLC